MVGWQVKGAAIAAFISLVAASVAAALDGRPETVADWGLVISQATVIYGLFFARQNNVSSEATRSAGVNVK